MKNEHMRKPAMLDASKDFLLGDGYGRGTPISIRSYLSILKGTIFASCLFVVVTWIAIGYALHGKEAGEIVEVNRQARSAARLFAEQSSRKINEIDAWLREGAYELWRNPSPARVREIITTRGWILNTQMQIRFVDSQGREIGANFDQIGSLEPPFKNSSFRGVLEKFVEPLIIDQTHLDRISSNWSTQLTRRIAFGSGEIKGEITASLDSNSFENFSKTLPKEWEFRLSLIGEDKLTQTSSVEIVNETDVKLHEFCYISGANGEEGRFPSIKMTPSFAIACMRLPDAPIFAVAAVIRGKTLADASEADAKRYYTIGSSITLMILIISLASGSSVLMRHKHELAIVIAEELLEESVECLSDGFVVYDREDRLVLFNTQFRNTFNRIAELIRPGEKFSVLNDAIIKAYPDMVCNPTLRDWVNGRLNAGPLSHPLIFQTTANV